MGLPLRDSFRHTYGEYLTWPEDVTIDWGRTLRERGGAR
jgi:hypothetical protein